jgi:phosphoglycolate phosphatase-like HAD superfamily hydrolase
VLNFKAKHKYLVGIDSDGCAFDTMELKHKECFIPNIINHFELQGISKYAREAAEFVNLYSRSRGVNRFPALIETFEWLRRRPEVKARNVTITIPRSLVEWIRRETKLGNPALEAEVARTHDPDLEKTLRWSKAVNESIAKMVRGVPPFPFVRECLQRLDGRVDVLVVSATPQEALVREWDEHDLARFVAAICGQEIGTKRQSLAAAAQYEPDHTLMVGDAMGDYNAAVANKALFFPINPGDEESSWKRLFEEGIERFLSGTFASEYQRQLLDEFEKCLPETPPWPVERAGK